MLWMPAPTNDNWRPLGTVTTQSTPAGLLKTSESNVVDSERKRSFRSEKLKVAMSLGPFGGPSPSQFTGSFQSPFVGSRFHAALPAKTSEEATRTRAIASGRIVFMISVLPLV